MKAKSYSVLPTRYPRIYTVYVFCITCINLGVACRANVLMINLKIVNEKCYTKEKFYNLHIF